MCQNRVFSNETHMPDTWFTHALAIFHTIQTSVISYYCCAHGGKELKTQNSELSNYLLLPADFFAPFFLAVVRFLAVALFLAGALFFAVALFLEVFFFGAGTLAPFSRASDKPIAIACLRLVTFFPLLPLRNVPFFLR